MKRNRLILTTFMLSMTLICAAVTKAAPSIKITNLSCEYFTNPIGLEVTKPRLAWKLTSLLSDKNADLWNSGKVESDQSIQVYDGEDIIAVTRTCFDDGLGGAPNHHDANFMTFHRIIDFRKGGDFFRKNDPKFYLC